MTTFTDQTSVVLAVRHPIFLCGLAHFLAEHDDVRIVASCVDDFDACEKARAHVPDVCILDDQMTHLTAVELIRVIHGHCPRTAIVVLTSAAPEELIHLIRDAGASGVFSKSDVPEALLQCIRRVASGETCFPVGYEAHSITTPEPDMSWSPGSNALTPREAEVAAYVSAGLASKEVARRLGLSEGTVKVHLGNIYRKIGVCNRTALAYALSRTRDSDSHLPAMLESLQR